MLATSHGPSPLRDLWVRAPGDQGAYYENRETLGVRSLFHWHCGSMMNRVVEFQRDDTGAIISRKCNSWICPVCKVRYYRTDQYCE